MSKCKMYLLVEVESGHSFIEDFVSEQSKNTIQLFVSFNKQRFKTAQIAMTPNPVFNEGFLFSLGNSCHDLARDMENLLGMQEGLTLLAVKHDENGESSAISHEALEWRDVLHQPQTKTVEMKEAIQ